MERQLMRAYDKITMPDRCSRRIEDMLLEQEKKEQRCPPAIRQRPQRGSWAAAAALVCLVVLLSAGSVAAFLGMQGIPAASNPVAPEFTQTTDAAQESTAETTVQRDPDGFLYGEEAQALLESMCHVMPAWDGYVSLDDVFWTEFIVRLLNEYEYADPSAEQEKMLSRQVTTPAGQGILMENKVYVPKERIASFVQEVMGCELPEFIPSGEFQNRISYEDGTFAVDVTELNRFQYVLESRKSGKSPKVTYSIYSGTEQEAVGQVTFLLWDAENERGFIILGRIVSMQMAQIQSPEIEKVALAFAEGYFSNDIEAVKRCMSERNDWERPLHYLVQSTYNSDKGPEYRIKGVRVFDTEGGAVLPVAYVDFVSAQGRGFPVWSLILEMVQEEDGWKVRYWTEGRPESWDPNRDSIYRAAELFASDYLDGKIRDSQEYLGSGLGKPPVYEGDGAELKIQSITVYFDPLEVNPDTGEQMAEAYVEFGRTEDAPNFRALYLHFVKMGSSWKIDHIGEG